MFSALPQRFTAPLGLLPDAQKLGFRSHPGGLARLATQRNIADADNYWDQYTLLFDSASEVYSLITPGDIRRALLDAPENIATLIRVICAKLFTLLSDHTFPNPPPNNALAFMKAATGERNTTKEVLNCLRVLQRVLPVVFEVEGESSVFEVEVLWKREELPDDIDEAAQPPQFVIDDEDESDGESAKPSVASTPKKTAPSLGEKLFGAIVDLMYCCGFTVPTKLQVDHHKINFTIWEKGVGSATDPGVSTQFDSNKTEVLRLLLILLSRQIYVPPSSLFNKPSLYSLHLVQKLPRRDVLTILCSLLNTAMNSNINHSTLSSMAGRLPYNHLVFKGEDSRSTLVSTSLQTLLAILDFQSGSARDVETTEQPTAKTNAFRYFLMKLHRTQDFAFIMEGMMGIFGRHLAASNNMLPGAQKALPYMTETILLLWKVLELNKKFRVYLLEHERSMDMVAALLCYNLEIKDKPQQHGVCRTLSYILQSLSAEPAFGAQLSRPLTLQVPSKWAVPGTATDFLIHSIYSIVATTSGSLNALYPALVITLSNLAPYFQKLSVTSSTRLIQLITSFSNPMFLLSDEGHPRLLFFMLEMFNGVIQHHLAENPNLVYGILSAHKVFEDLGTFTLGKGIYEIKRLRALKEQVGATVKSPRQSQERDSTSSAGEKARLMSESSQELSSEAGASDVVSTSATLPDSPTTTETVGRSEKALGKQKERAEGSIDIELSPERIAALGVGRNGFIPTQEWVSSWQEGLPLDAIMLMISEVLPKVQMYQASRNKTNAPAEIADYLGTLDLEGVLPPAPPLAPRKFMWSDASIIWLTSLIWGEIYLRGMSPLGIWNATTVRLFYVKHQQTQAAPSQITEAVAGVVGGFLRRTNSEVSITGQRR
ncbi:hypothetical protein CYLTODRAFT_396572 [Cylindrobasidium torrendii FP15055 ss-10]|uniref:High-temperature-induced dauer-formation protein n=1 Tax=Cylindrobasidium torrendii FP15055 ss-10 TaxID=1314674 RepID=A0A0D7BC23_9AGAR|nr:hypothetical protein CYLTODRAFT_396572 [Cylindrobasidium torrendii FP15055 ss-10]